MQHDGALHKTVQRKQPLHKHPTDPDIEHPSLEHR